MAKHPLQTGMYVRCPADSENEREPRVFVCGQIVSINEDTRKAKVMIHDPFNLVMMFENLPHGVEEYLTSNLIHCSLFVGSSVVYQGQTCKVLTSQQNESGFYEYFIQDDRTKNTQKASEIDIIASLTNGRIDPAYQLLRYEFQNPCWYFGHSVVSKNINILENSIYGFKELAGAKIYLLPHQVNSIMRCLQDSPCRYMLADEVGMGKTVEAISILKLFMLQRSNIKSLILVPDQLKEQWKKELLIKFGIDEKPDANRNSITVKSISEITMEDYLIPWHFVIIDEVHRYLQDSAIYEKLRKISSYASNILLLSATPVQQRKEEYLALLRLLQPQKYDQYTPEQFGTLIEKQSRIIQKTALVLDDLNDMVEEYEHILDDGSEPHDSEDINDLFEEITDELDSINKDLNDIKLTEMLNQLDFDTKDCSIYQIKVIISYICGNYQIENNIIRNRRRILENDDNGTRLLPVRQLKPLPYQLNKDFNTYEALCYECLVDWITHGESSLDVEKTVQPLLNAFFSSPWAFSAKVKEFIKQGIIQNDDLVYNTRNWIKSEEYIVQHIVEILDDPDRYEHEHCSRICSVLNLLYDELYDQKVVLFTNNLETFKAYRTALSNTFKENEISFFGSDMDLIDLEANAYRFQNEAGCRIMLCDYTGGEGRNFQCADYIVHIDLPWDASLIEQRIGRLDRLERDPERSTVTSVVVYAENTFEDALFDFFRKGLRIFEQSLSGMEIIMKDINHEIFSAVRDDFRYGLSERIPTIIERAEKMRDEIRKEQNYDAAGFVFKPMYAELRRLIEYYAKNENDLFANAMTEWASLAGFHGYRADNGIITYDATSFSSKSAINSLLIPPKWVDYIGSAQNQFMSQVAASRREKSGIRGREQSLSGTFIRKQAIENDYLHFFAPGDAIFECITANAIQSCKGRACAVYAPAGITWKGLVFTWALVPNEAYLFEHGVSIYAMSPYRNYMMTEQVVTVISFDNPDDVNDAEIIREYLQITTRGIKGKNYTHLGKRGSRSAILKGHISAQSNQAWFKQEYSGEKWRELVIDARKEAQKKANEQFSRRSNLRGAREEMQRILSANTAKGQYYKTEPIDLNKLQREQQLILDAIKTSKVVLESAAFVWMEKPRYEETTD